MENERPIAQAALQLDILCRCDHDKHKDRIWQLAEDLFGKSNDSLWKDHGGIDKIREMIHKNLDVFQSADTTGVGFFRRLFEMWFSGEFVDETGTDLMSTALASGDDELKGNLVYLIIEKMGIGEKVLVACVDSYERNGGYQRG